MRSNSTHAERSAVTGWSDLNVDSRRTLHFLLVLSTCETEERSSFFPSRWWLQARTRYHTPAGDGLRYLVARTGYLKRH